MKRRRNVRVLARFKPMTTNDLHPELIKYVGKEAVFRYHKFIDEEDTPYSNQWVLTAEDQQFGDYWSPEHDLEILQEKHAVATIDDTAKPEEVAAEIPATESETEEKVKEEEKGKKGKKGKKK